MEYSFKVRFGRRFFGLGNQKKKADPSSVPCLSQFISFRINTRNVCRNRAGAGSTEVEIIAEAKQQQNDMTLHKINFPGIKEGCDASIETEGTVRQPHQICGLNRPVMRQRRRAVMEGDRVSPHSSALFSSLRLSCAANRWSFEETQDGDDNGALWVAFRVLSTVSCV